MEPATPATTTTTTTTTTATIMPTSSGANSQHRSSGKRNSSKNTRPKIRGTSLLEKKEIKEKNAIEIEDKTICFICANKTKYWAIGSCNHPCCVLCSLRLKVLFDTNDCPYCKVDLGKVIYADTNTKLYTQLQVLNSEFYDPKLNFVCQNNTIFEYAIHVLSFNCPSKGCNYTDDEGWPGLKNHAQSVHSTVFCELCLEYKKVFPHEHLLFHQSALRKHYKYGNGRDFKGHPECGFCRISFYDNDMLFDHLRKNHEQCFICQNLHINKDVYYQNYNSMVDHFENAHFPCRHPSCIEQKFVVFESAIDLKAHELEVHGKNVVGQRAKWEAKQVPITIEHERYTRPGHNDHNRNSSHNGNSRNKDRSHQPGPAASTEPNPSKTTKLSSSSANGNNNEPQNSSTKKLSKPVGYGKLSTPQPTPVTPETSVTPIDNKELSAHTDLLNFALKALNNSSARLEKFRQLTTRLKSRQITPRAYYEDLKKNFFPKDAEIVHIIKSVSELMKDDALTSSLTAIILDNRVKSQQFPSLAPVESNLNTLNLTIQRQSKNAWGVNAKPQPTAKPKPRPETSKGQTSTLLSTKVVSAQARSFSPLVPGLPPTSISASVPRSGSVPASASVSKPPPKPAATPFSGSRTNGVNRGRGIGSLADLSLGSSSKASAEAVYSEALKPKPKAGSQAASSPAVHFPSLDSTVPTSFRGTGPANNPLATSIVNIKNKTKTKKNQDSDSNSKSKNIVLRLV